MQYILISSILQRLFQHYPWIILLSLDTKISYREFLGVFSFLAGAHSRAVEVTMSVICPTLSFMSLLFSILGNLSTKSDWYFSLSSFFQFTFFTFGFGHEISSLLVGI